MGWFTRHLNWTVIIFTVCSNVISHYLIKLFLIISNIPPGGPLYDPDIEDILSVPFTSFAFDAELLLSNILLIIGFNWIVSKKNRSKANLWYFIVFLIVDLPVFLSYIIEFDLPSIMYLFRMIAIFLWLAGWIILLSLKNKSVSSISRVNLN
jgi:hypothetical protein